MIVVLDFSRRSVIFSS